MILLLTSLAYAQEVDGFLELRGNYQLGVDGLPVQAIERVRPTFSAPLGERVALSTTVEALAVQGRDTTTELENALDGTEVGDLLELAECTWPEDDNELLDINSVTDVFRVERLYVDLFHPRVDVRVGRQAVNWGSALLVNPTDPFPEVLLTEPWRFRSGVNAARFEIPIKDVHAVRVIVGSNDTFTKARVATRGTVNVLGADVSAVGAYRQETEDGLVGFDVKGTLGVGYWFEGAMHLDPDDEPTTELAAGIDYSFPLLQSFIVAGQYYRNGAGGDAAPSLSGAFVGPTCAGLDLTDGAEPDPFAPVFTGENYGLLMVSAGINWSWGASALWLQNLDDGSAIAIPTVSWSRGRWTIAGAAQIPVQVWGDSGEFKPSADDLTLSIPGPGDEPLASADLSGLVPTATFTAWTRVHF